MPSPTTARVLLRLFLQGADLPATDQRVTIPPVRLPTYSSVRAILAAGDEGRGARGGVSGREGPRAEGGRSAGEEGRNRYTGRPRGEAETGGRMTTTRRKTTAERECGRWVRDQVSSNGDRGERQERDGQEESNGASERWSGESAEDSEGSETEEEGMTAVGPEG